MQRMDMFQAAEAGNLEELQERLLERSSLMSLYAQVNLHMNENVESLLIVAARNGHLNIVEYLHSLRADLNATTRDGATPLMEATQSGHLEVVKFLIRNRADINRKKDYGLTALYLAVRESEEAIMQELISAGADVNIATKSGSTPLSAAAGTKNRCYIMNQLISAGANVNVCCKGGISPLLAAIISGKSDVIELLILADVDLDFTYTSIHSTPLIVAASRDSAIFKMLISAGADLNKTAENKLTPLHTASECGSVENAKYLIDAGANIEALCAKGWSPLVYAANGGHAEVVRLLFHANAQFSCQMPGLNTQGLSQIETLNEIRLNAVKVVVNQSIINSSSFFSTPGLDPHVTRSILEMVLERPVLRDETIADQASHEVDLSGTPRVIGRFNESCS